MSWANEKMDYPFEVRDARRGRDGAPAFAIAAIQERRVDAAPAE